MKLTAGQIRVLGVLIEKSLANPDAYPMTLNAITTGCNQKNNRDPITDYTEGDVGKSLHALSLLDLVVQAPPAMGARVNRFKHESERRLAWGRRQQAVMAELMLRGGQTVGELKGRIARMMVELDIPGVQLLLDELGGGDSPWVCILPRQAGQSSIRYGHLLADELESPPQPQPSQSHTSLMKPKVREAPKEDDVFVRIEALESELNALRSELARLGAKIDFLSG